MAEAALNRALARVVDAAHALIAALTGKGRPEERLEQLRSACREGAEFLVRTHSLMESLSPRVLRDEARERLLAEVERAFGETGRGISAILHSGEASNLPVLQGAVKAFEEGLSHIYNCLQTLQELERKDPGLCPLPLLDDLLRVAMNVWEGKATPSALETWFRPAADMLRRLSGQCKLFACAHPEEESLARDALELTQTLGDGVGALVLFSQSGDRAALADGMSLLAQNSMPLNAAVIRMDAVARQASDFSSLPALQEAWLAVAQKGVADPAVAQAILDGLESLQRFLNDEVRALHALPLAWTIPEPLQVAQMAVERVDLTGVRETMASPALAVALCQVRDQVHLTRAAIQQVHDALQQELRKTEGFPNLEHLKELMGRLQTGTVSHKGFLVRFAYLASSLERLCEQARESGRGEVGRLLERQREGFETITGYFKSFDVQSLRDGMAIIEETLPRLRAMQGDVSSQRRKMGPETGYDEAVPELLLRLDRLVRDLEQGTLQPDAFAQKVRQEHERLSELAAEFRSRMALILKRSGSPEIMEAAREYGDGLQDILAGLKSMQACSNPNLLYGGFERARRGILTVGSRGG
ncbi:MAG: hypothetical protein ACYCW6_02275 [Candidatus Xenobia bacterium]